MEELRFQSKILLSPDKPKLRIENFKWLSEQLEVMGNNWLEYIKQHVSVTNKLFAGKPEYPWSKNERVAVSSLAASIMRSNKNALIVEELPVHKASAKIEAARCDLWAHIPKEENDEHFSFYLEGKRFRKEQTIDSIEKELRGKGGIIRMFQDNAKARDGQISLRSTYTNDRKHPHYIVGMIIAPMQGEFASQNNSIDNIFSDVYGSLHTIQNVKRDMSKFPSVGIYLGQSTKSGNEALMFASFSIIGRSGAGN